VAVVVRASAATPATGERDWKRDFLSRGRDTATEVIQVREVKVDEI
jgi:hypothetical protein